MSKSPSWLTRGALRHHFGDKRGLFETIFEDVETEVTQQTAAALGAVVDSWELIENGIITFLDLCQEPEVIQIAMIDAPTVLGWQTWRAIEARHGLGLIQAGLSQAIEAGVIAPQPVEPLAHLLLSAVIEAALLISRSPDLRPDTEQALVALIRGLRAKS